jgi:hypothetical protein
MIAITASAIESEITILLWFSNRLACDLEVIFVVGASSVAPWWRTSYQFQQFK